MSLTGFLEELVSVTVAVASVLPRLIQFVFGLGLTPAWLCHATPVGIIREAAGGTVSHLGSGRL